MPSAIYRTMNGVTHGLETGLLDSSRIEESRFDRINIMHPEQQNMGDLAFALMPVPWTAINATRALSRQFGWTDDRLRKRLLTLQEEMQAVWSAAISAGLDEVAPDRPRTGILGTIADKTRE